MNHRKRVLFGIGSLATLALIIGLISLSAMGVSAEAQEGPPESPVEMSGYSFFDGELIESEYVISDEALNQCLAKATLVPLEGENYELRFGEICGFGPRLTIWDLTISEEGEVGGVFHAQTLYPASEAGSPMAEIWLHTGCMMVGDFPSLPLSAGVHHVRHRTSLFLSAAHLAGQPGNRQHVASIAAEHQRR